MGMNIEQIQEARKNKTKVVIHFDDNQPNPAGIIVNQSRATSNCTIQITDPARGYGVGDKVAAMPYDLLPYTWARTLPNE